MILKNIFSLRLRVLFLVFLCEAGRTSSGQLPANPMDPARDPVKRTFVIMGCNRIQHKDWKRIKADDPSLGREKLHVHRGLTRWYPPGCRPGSGECR